MQKDAIQELINEAKAQGFTVYAPEKLTTYFYYTTGEKIGYCQWDRVQGRSFSTVHKPCNENGTGFKVDSFQEGFCFAPHWARSAAGIVKFNSWDEFSRKHWQQLKQY